MDIAFIAKRYDTVGGTEKDLYHLSGLLSSFGHNVTIYCQEIRVEPLPGITLRKVPKLFFSRTLRLWLLAWLGPRMAFNGGHDLIIGFTRILWQDIVRCGGGTHRIFLERIGEAEDHSKKVMKALSPYHKSLLMIEKEQLQEGNIRILAISEIVKKEIMDVYGVRDEAIEVIYDGIDTTVFSPENRNIYRGDVRREFGISEEAPLLLFIGNGFRRKGLDTLIKSVSTLKNDAVRLLVVGVDSDINAYRNIAKELGIERRVIFAGTRKHPERFYAAADIFVLPSLQEAFGNAVLEAMASGVPAVTTRVAGASELFSNGLERYLLEDPRDVESLARIITGLLDPSVRKDLSVKVRTIAQGYTLEYNARKIERLCIKVLEEKRRCRNI